MRGAIWFRSDLRIDDNPALTNALNDCEEVIGVYIFSANHLNSNHHT